MGCFFCLLMTATFVCNFGFFKTHAIHWNEVWWVSSALASFDFSIEGHGVTMQLTSAESFTRVLFASEAQTDLKVMFRMCACLGRSHRGGSVAHCGSSRSAKTLFSDQTHKLLSHWALSSTGWTDMAVFPQEKKEVFILVQENICSEAPQESQRAVGSLRFLVRQALRFYVCHVRFSLWLSGGCPVFSPPLTFLVSKLWSRC